MADRKDEFLQSQDQMKTASGGEGPRGLCMSPEGDRLFCANNDSGTVAILPVDRETGLPGAPLQTLALPFAACVRSYSTERNGE